MPRRSNLDGLIHCDSCGEDYSATYKHCPFCGQPPQDAHPPRSTREIQVETLEDEEEDGYVFDGQDAFDEAPQPVRPPRAAKGGKRLASNSRHAPASGRPQHPHRESGGSRPPEPINWPRLITFLCSLVIIAAALVIVFTVIYPQLRQDPTPQTSVSQAPTDSAQPSPSSQAGPVLAGLTLESGPVALAANGTYQLTLTTTPADWDGQVTWTSSNMDYATVDANGLVTNVNSTSAAQSVLITASAEGMTAQCTISCAGVPLPASEPPASQPPASQPPASSGDITPGPATIINAGGGLRVRAEPSTSAEILASLFNGNDIQVVADAGNGWAEITFSGSGGESITGYIMYEYISQS